MSSTFFRCSKQRLCTDRGTPAGHLQPHSLVRLLAGSRRSLNIGLWGPMIRATCAGELLSPSAGARGHRYRIPGRRFACLGTLGSVASTNAQVRCLQALRVLCEHTDTEAGAEQCVRELTLPWSEVSDAGFIITCKLYTRKLSALPIKKTSPPKRRGRTAECWGLSSLRSLQK